jgi:glycosyltransferase involved in cell wall biosynthesis
MSQGSQPGGIAPRVLHYMAAFSSPSQTFIYDLICALRDLGLESAVATRRRTLAEERPFEPVFIVKNRSLLRRWLGQLRDPAHLQLRDPAAVRRVVASWRPNLLHAHTGMSAIRLAHALHSQGIALPLVVSFHGSDVNANPYRIKGYRQRLEALLQRANTRFVVPSSFLRQRLIERYGAQPAHCHVIPNAVNPRFLHGPMAAKPRSGVITILCNARLTEVKGHDYLLRAVASLLSQGVDARLLLVGEGELRDSLQQLARQLGIAERVTFAGYVPHSELSAYLQQADIYVQPSVVSSTHQEESFGVAALEACAAGLPVIVSRCGGLPELLPREGALVVEPADSEALCRALMTLLEDEAGRLAYAARCREHAEQHFTAERVYPQYLKLYRALLVGGEG